MKKAWHTPLLIITDIIQAYVSIYIMEMIANIARQSSILSY
jgi:hypothetical protein